MPTRKDKAHEICVVNVRLVKEPSLYSARKIQSPDDVIEVMAKELAQYDREVFCILNLKSDGSVINMNIASVGTLNASMVSPREVFKSSILSNAASIIAIHNHPSSNLNVSREDKEVTKRLQNCGALLDIKLLDHIIVAGETGRILSMKASGMLPEISAKDWER